MSTPTLRKTALFILCVIGSIALAHLYMKLLGKSFKFVVAFHAAVFLFLGLAVFSRKAGDFLLFALILAIPSALDVNLIYRPLEDVETPPFSIGVGLSLVDLIMVAMLVRWLLNSAMERSHRPITLGHPVGTLMLLWIAHGFFVSLFNSTHFEYSAYETYSLFKGFILFFLLTNIPATLRNIHIICVGSLIGAGAHALFAVWQYATKSTLTVSGSQMVYFGPSGYRALGWLGSFDITAILVVTAIPLALVYVFMAPQRLARWTALLFILIGMIAIMSTKVRMAGLVIVVSTLIMLTIGGFKKWISHGAIVKTVLVGVVLFALASPFVIKRFAEGSYGEARLPLVYTALNMIKDNWLGGVGMGNYGFHAEKYVPVRMRHTWSATVHNEYLLRFVETGIFGFLIYYSLILAVILRLWRSAVRSVNPWVSAFATAVFATMVASLFHRLTSIYHLQPIYHGICVFFALSCLLHRMTLQEAESGSPDEVATVRPRVRQLRDVPALGRSSRAV